MAPDGARSEESDHTRELQPLLKRTSEIGCAQALGRGWPQAMVQAMVRAMVHAMSNDFGQPDGGRGASAGQGGRVGRKRAAWACKPRPQRLNDPRTFGKPRCSGRRQQAFLQIEPRQRPTGMSSDCGSCHPSLALNNRDFARNSRAYDGSTVFSVTVAGRSQDGYCSPAHLECGVFFRGAIHSDKPHRKEGKRV